MSKFNFETPVLDDNNKLTLPYQKMIQRIEGSAGGSSGAGVIVVPSSANPVFNTGGALVAYFEYLITQDSAATLVVTSPGQIVIFAITQDGIGGWQFTWPTSVKKFSLISAAAGAKSIQAGIVGSDGNVYPIGAMTIN